MARRLVGLALLLAAANSVADSGTLSGDRIRATVAGAVFEVDTPLGVVVPITYGEDGRVTGRAQGLSYILGSETDSGRWWIASDRLCQKWTRWFDGAIQCLRLSQDGNRIHWQRDDGETGTATISQRTRTVASIPQEHYRPSGDGIANGEPAAPPTSTPAAPLAGAVTAATLPAFRPAPVESAPRPSEHPSTSIGPAESAAKAERGPSAEPRAAAPASRPVSQRPAAPGRPPVPPPVPLFRVAGVDIDDVLNVREGPSADHSIIGSLLPDAGGVRIVGQCQSYWCPIQYRGMTGWVNSMYLTQEAAPLSSARGTRAMAGVRQ